jgi:hypothetical protein
MPSNNTGPIMRKLVAEYPNKIARLLNPSRLSSTAFKHTYAIDNGAFARFNEPEFFRFLDESKKHQAPMFVVVPDVVGCHDRTAALWCHYEQNLRAYGYPLAFVAQDGCTPGTIPDSADWIFIGGKDPWKIKNIHNFMDLGRPVHVGRVNTINRFKYCESLGVQSVDGTGWVQYINKDHYFMLDWLSGNLKQMSLFGDQNENNNKTIQD